MNATLPFKHLKGGNGKSTICNMLADEMTRPQGTWREFWTKHLRRISPDNRLPRGFRAPKPLLDLDAPGNVQQMPIIKHANDAPLNVDALREAIQSMKSMPAKKR
jgi:hypothetical protein